MDIEKNIMKNYTQRRLEEFDDEFNWLLSGSITTFDVLGFEQRLNVDMTRIDLKSFLSTSINQALAEDRERVRGKIRKAPIWKLVPNTPRMIMCSDKELDDLLSPLDKPLTDNKKCCGRLPNGESWGHSGACNLTDKKE